MKAALAISAAFSAAIDERTFGNILKVGQIDDFLLMPL